MLIFADCESFLIRPGLLAPPLVCMSAAWKMSDGTVDSVLYARKEALVHARRFLEDRFITAFVGHNFAYDLAVLCDADPSLLPLVFEALAQGRIKDTKIREELIDIANGRIQDKGQTLVWRKEKNAYERPDYSLGALELRYTGVDRTSEKNDPNGWRMRYSELANTPVEEWPKEARDYAIADSVGTLAVYEAQAKTGFNFATEDDQVRAAFTLHLASCWGMRTDPKAIDELERTLKIEHERIQHRLRKVGFVVPEVLTPGRIAKGEAVETYVDVIDRKGQRVRKPACWKKDTKAIKAYVKRVYERKKKPVPMTAGRVKKATGQRTPEIATNKDACAESGSRLLMAFSGDTGVEKVLQLIPALRRGVKFPMNVRFNVLMNTARTSSSSWEDRLTGETHGMNLQNIPTGRRVGGVRECFVPRGELTP